MAFVPLCALGFGIAQHFVVMFKGTPIMPTDLLSLKTAGAVASGYNYVLTPKMVVALCATAVCACSLSLLKPDYRSFFAERAQSLRREHAGGRGSVCHPGRVVQQGET